MNYNLQYGLDEMQVKRAWVTKDLLNFTRYFFFEDNKSRFVVGKHHRLICDKLNDVLQGKINRLIINIAPRYSKTELAVQRFIEMGLAINPRSNFIHLSYSSALAQANSVAIKDTLYSDSYMEMFDTRIKYGSDTKTQWNTEQGGGVYATSTLGQITGFGAGTVLEEGKPYEFSGAIIIDDPIKPQDALSDTIRTTVNQRFETTIRSRVNDRNTPIIIIMQRLHEDDLCGYLMKKEPDKWDVLSLPCIVEDEDGNEQPLWPFKHTLEELREIEEADPFVFDTQYMQNATPIEGFMYTRYKLYDALPVGSFVRKNYTDTADTGADFLCSICYNEYEDGMYITDVLFTDRPMEYTEPTTARMLTDNETEVVNVESNNGGRGFARNVEKNVRTIGNLSMVFNWFSQTQNKQSRIFSHSAEVQNIIHYPSDWESRWPKFAAAIKKHRKNGKNAHDDAPDVLTGMVEMFGSNFSPMTEEDYEEYESTLY